MDTRTVMNIIAYMIDYQDNHKDTKIEEGQLQELNNLLKLKFDTSKKILQLLADNNSLPSYISQDYEIPCTLREMGVKV